MLAIIHSRLEAEGLEDPALSAATRIFFEIYKEQGISTERIESRVVNHTVGFHALFSAIKLSSAPNGAKVIYQDMLERMVDAPGNTEYISQIANMCSMPLSLVIFINILRISLVCYRRSQQIA